MPVVLDASVGGANSNSYVTSAEADAYFNERMNAAPWTGLVGGTAADDKARALISATRRLDQEQYVGSKTNAVQALKWPREGAVYPDGDDVPSNIIPVSLKYATFEQALYMLTLGTTDPSMPTGLEPFKRLKTTTVELEMRTDREPEDVAGLAPAVPRLLDTLLISYDDTAGDDYPGTFRIERA